MSATREIQTWFCPDTGKQLTYNPMFTLYSVVSPIGGEVGFADTLAKAYVILSALEAQGFSCEVVQRQVKRSSFGL
jgi:hypothetical protein